MKTLILFKENVLFIWEVGSGEEMTLQQRAGGQDWTRFPDFTVFNAV